MAKIIKNGRKQVPSKEVVLWWINWAWKEIIPAEPSNPAVLPILLMVQKMINTVWDNKRGEAEDPEEAIDHKCETESKGDREWQVAE